MRLYDGVGIKNKVLYNFKFSIQKNRYKKSFIQDDLIISLIVERASHLQYWFQETFQPFLWSNRQSWRHFALKHRSKQFHSRRRAWRCNAKEYEGECHNLYHCKKHRHSCALCNQRKIQSHNQAANVDDRHSEFLPREKLLHCRLESEHEWDAAN